MQLIDPSVTIWDPFKKKTIDEAEVEKLWGVKPPLIPHLLALLGDKSDNSKFLLYLSNCILVKKIPMIGPKTAVNLLNQYKTVEGIIENLTEVANNLKLPL